MSHVFFFVPLDIRFALTLRNTGPVNVFLALVEP